MSEQSEATGKKKEADFENMDPVHVIRKGAIAASIWQRQSPSGFAYYDYSISRSSKSMSSDKTGYSKNYFETNQLDLIEVIQRASGWIVERRELEKKLAQNILAA